MKVTAEPIVHRDSYTGLIETEINAYFLETLFRPLQEVLASRVRENAQEVSALWHAISEGRVWYADGVFTGEFAAEVSRELRVIGARKTPAGFAIDKHEIPFALRGILALSRHRSEALHAALLALLLLMEANIPRAAPGFHLKLPVDKIVVDLQQQLVRTVSATEAPIKVPPPPPGMADQIAEELTTETESAIKGFSLEETQKLRAKVQQNLAGGGRIDRLEAILQSEFGVSQRKAHFLADNQTSRLVASFRKERYLALGATEYVWDTSHDEKVRPTHGESNNHRILDGRKFAWAVPPVVDSATGRQCHPGEDYNCRCVARPVLNFA